MEIIIDKLEKYYTGNWLIKQKHPTLPLTIWNYSQATQYEGQWDDITLMARGLVTCDQTGKIVARPFKKFFNLEENKHRPTDNFEVYEKMDGSLIVLFYAYNQWIVASRGSFTSDQAVAARNIVKQFDLSKLSQDTTYLFEFTSPYNRIVIDYGKDEKLTLLGGIKTDYGYETSYPNLKIVANNLGCDLVKQYTDVTDYRSLKQIIKDDQEGFVIKFSNGQRIKIKGDEYIKLHRLMTQVSNRDIWQALADGKDLQKIYEEVPDEFYGKIKEFESLYKLEFKRIKFDYNLIFQNIMNELESDHTKKDFALQAIKHKYSGILFSMYNQNKEAVNTQIWQIVRPDKWEKI